MLPKPSLSIPIAVLAMTGCGEGPPSSVYNLFRQRLGPDLFCAVPEDQPVPTFIEATNWLPTFRV